MRWVGEGGALQMGEGSSALCQLLTSTTGFDTTQPSKLKLLGSLDFWFITNYDKKRAKYKTKLPHLDTLFLKKNYEINYFSGWQGA